MTVHQSWAGKFVEDIQEGCFFHLILIDGDRDSNLYGETHSREPFINKLQAHGYYFQI